METASMDPDTEIMIEAEDLFGLEFPVSKEEFITKYEELQETSGKKRQSRKIYNYILASSSPMFLTDNIKIEVIDPKDLIKCWQCDGGGSMAEVSKQGGLVIYECDVCKGKGKIPKQRLEQSLNVQPATMQTELPPEPSKE